MAVSGLSGIENMLQQMRAVVRTAQGGVSDPAELSPNPTGFAAELERSLKRVSAAQKSANAQAQAFELGAPDVSLNDVMIDLQKASIGFQTALQVRNRLVSAYREIASMPL
ncbi:flagellar hook-basal body complex protein FliE [Bordetella genomosp. 13]|uniref:flagellar hook-basal body complex protein FliE n=1 Tax=Bordetella genomosp. 13 TaxID=463040 RepID=UPI0011A19679|nr:flagellar hook-basal body complex protein FliE [Bordetella genomosp. 13]